MTDVNSKRRLVRLRSEVDQINKHPSPGIRLYFDDDGDDLTNMKVEMTGPSNSPFAGRLLTLSVSAPPRYPFDPPVVQFVSRVYHPNVDPTGRICLQALKPKPTGSWNVTLNIITVLASIRVLLGEPNLEDPLMPEIAEEYARDEEAYRHKARNTTGSET